MKYLVTTFKIIPNSEIARDLLASIAEEAGFETFEESDEGMKGYVQESLFAADVLDECIKDFPLPDVTISYTVSPAEDKDWNETWEQAGFEPIVIDNRCIIYDAKQAENGTIKMANEKLTDAPHEKGETLQASETSSPLSIAIDARMAFGTGTHDTTQMIVRQLIDMHVEGKRVLDCGCGTGIGALRTPATMPASTEWTSLRYCRVTLMCSLMSVACSTSFWPTSTATFCCKTCLPSKISWHPRPFSSSVGFTRKTFRC